MAEQILPDLEARVVTLALAKRQAAERAASLQFTEDVAPVAASLGVDPGVTISFGVEQSGTVTATWADQPEHA